MRWSAGLCGSKVAFNGIDLRGPSPKDQMIPSVRPLKWQLEQACQPSLESRSMVEPVVPAGRLKLPREEKNISAPTAITSSGDPGAASLVVRIVLMTLSFCRLTTLTLRDTKLLT